RAALGGQPPGSACPAESAAVSPSAPPPGPHPAGPGQDAVRELLSAIYEQDFLASSYGFRPGRSAHDAIRLVDQMVHRGEGQWIVEADLVSFFDSLDRTEV